MKFPIKTITLTASAITIGILIWWAGSGEIKLTYPNGNPVQGVLEIIDQAGSDSLNKDREQHEIVDGSVTLGWKLFRRGPDHESLYRITVDQDVIQSGHFALKRFGPSTLIVTQTTRIDVTEQE